jgi:predicted ArsR family transcriptional regulator
VSPVAGLEVLAAPTRWALYRYVADRRTPATRDSAAAAVGIGRALAAFHLEKLARAGLLEVAPDEPRPGRAGRPPKRYRRSGREVSVQVPPRDHALAARVFAAAVARGGRRARADLIAAARAAGERIARSRRGVTARHRSAGATIAQRLAALGYEPYREDDATRLANCPFDAVASADRATVCAMNLALVGAIVRGTAGGRASVELDPRTSECCVVVHANDRPRRPRRAT